MKRKRGKPSVGARKKQRLALDQSTNATPSPSHAPHPLPCSHPVLQHLYPKLSTLRHHLLSRLPASSKNRRQRISQLGLTPPVPASDTSPVQHEHIDMAVAQLLDTALVASSARPATHEHAPAANHCDQELQTFTQQRSQSTPGATFRPSYHRQSEVCRPVARAPGLGCPSALLLHRAVTEYIM